MSLQLSDSLYPVDEVISSFVQCILAKHTFNECLFWLWELFFTTPNICEGIKIIYQQFYSHTNQNVATYVAHKILAYRETGVKRHIADIVNNLLTMSSSPYAYYIVKASQSMDGPSILYKKAYLMQQYHASPNISSLLCAIKSRDIKNIGAYASLCLATVGFDETKHAIILYANTSGNTNVDTGLCDGGIITISYLISRIINRVDSHKSKFTRARLSDVSKMESHFTRRSDNLLSKRRLYPTHSFAQPASYSRFTTGDVSFEDACRLSWTYYCFNSVEWNKRFEKYGGYLDIDKRKIIWSTDEEQEAFYSNGYCIDFDEQPTDITYMSLHPIEVIDDPYEWYETIVTLRLANLSL